VLFIETTSKFKIIVAMIGGSKKKLSMVSCALFFAMAFMTEKTQGFSPAPGRNVVHKPVVTCPTVFPKQQQSYSSASASASTTKSFFYNAHDSKSSLSSIIPKLNNEENENENETHSASSTTTLSQWVNHNKFNIAKSTALVAALALAIPSSALASSATDVISASTTYMDKLSETGFYQAFSLVFVSEIGDKTFFIAGLLAMKAGRLVSLIGSIGALAVMTIISVVIGQLFHVVPPGLTQGLPLDDIAAVIAFAFFGLKTLKEASEIDDSAEGVSGMDEEFADAEEAVEGSRTIKEVTAWGKIISTFGLVFAAEFGDRSFLSTIALSAAQNPVSVAVGAIAAHAVATGIAVAGGSYVAKYISEKAIGYIGGSLFLVFAVTTALGLF